MTELGLDSRSDCKVPVHSTMPTLRVLGYYESSWVFMNRNRAEQPA